MSQTDNKAGQSKSTPASTQTAKNTAQPGAKPGAKKGSKGDKLWIAGVLIMLVAGAAATILIRSGNDAPRPVVSADEDREAGMDEESMVEPDVDADMLEEEGEPETGSSTPASSAAALTITSDVRGADVYLNGKRVGVTPHKATPLSPGSYKVRVVRSGYETFERSVEVTGPDSSVRADLKRKPSAAKSTMTGVGLTVDSNVSGASVLIDGEERGTTPAQIQDLDPGTYELVVRAEGYKTYSKTIEYAGGARDIRVDLDASTIVLNEAVAVKHKHRFGGCEGVLRASADGLRFDTDHKDAFFVSFSDLEQFSFEGDTLSLKVAGGRNYNFEERNDNPDALARFHEQVDRAITN